MGRRLLNEVSSSQNSNSSGRVLAHEVDHNYLQPDRLRNTRRTLSRHQRNADELDPLQGVQSSPQVSVVVLAGSSSTQQPIGIVASNSRLRSSSVATTIGQQSTQETNIMQRRNYLVRATTTTTTANYTDRLTLGRQTSFENGSLRQRTAQPRSVPLMEPVRIS